MVTSSDKWITPVLIPKCITETDHRTGSGVKIEQIMSIRDAFDEVEKQLIQKTYEQYKTTTKIAEVLGISQPSASRKLRKYVIQR